MPATDLFDHEFLGNRDVLLALNCEEVIAMSEPVFVPDALDEASASFWARPDLDEVMAGAAPFREDETFEIADLTDEEWEAFLRAIHE